MKIVTVILHEGVYVSKGHTRQMVNRLLEAFPENRYYCITQMTLEKFMILMETAEDDIRGEVVKSRKALRL